MGLRANRDRALKELERSLAAGKLDAAVEQLRRLPDPQPNDFPVMNRAGDLLARGGRKAEAIYCYEKIAHSFANAGFVPKAIALYKKALRLNADRTQSLLELGSLLLKQDLPGEARPYLLRSAELFLAQGELKKARDVYEQLVVADPRDPRHRARLAEVCAAEGDTERAVHELAAVGAALVSAGESDEAEKAYRRAAEIQPDGVVAVAGLADCLRARGDLDQAIRVLGELVRKNPQEGELVGKLALYFQEAGRVDEALATLFGAQASAVGEDVFDTIFRLCREQGQADSFWQRFDPFAEKLAREGRLERITEVLDRLASDGAPGEVQALERWLELVRDREEPDAFKRVLVRLARAYEASSMEEQAARAREQLQKLEPSASGHEAVAAIPRKESLAPDPAAGAHAREPAGEPAGGGSPRPDDDEEVRRAEAPAVPLSRSDEEFVTGRLTQAEILEKYGLVDQALEQLRELTARFPGHVATQERRIELMRAKAGPAELRDALVDLALARRAAGDADGARLAVRQARRNAPLDSSMLATLERLSLIETEPPAAVGAAEVAPPSREREPEDAVPEVVIDFEEISETPPSAEPAAEREPGKPDPAAAKTEDTVFSVPGLDDDDDLSAITAALEDQIFDDDTTIVPEPESEQSLEEVFAAFKQHVREEVGSEDHRTHYDLGIGYKEMGLLDEAISELNMALGSEELDSEAMTMLAVCYLEKGALRQAADWYRRALALPGIDAATRATLSYDLAEILLRDGDAAAALALYRDVLAVDPSFRQVRNRISELESRLGS